jgi:hypothetical protein
MAATLKDDEAKLLCRKPKPTATTVRKVLEWASQVPSPGKIPFLLVMQTGNYLNKKSLAADFPNALDVCARLDSDPLWETIQKDWETYRIWHAIKCLGRVGDNETFHRLFQLAHEPILRIHWGAIKDAAAAKKIPIPQSSVDAQLEKEKQRGTGDFNAYYEVRKSSWPSQFDLGDGEDEPAPMLVVDKKTESKKAIKGEEEKASGPECFSSAHESNSHIKRIKAVLENSWKPSVVKSLYSATDLAILLVAQKRESDAAAICELLTHSVVFNKNYDKWTPVGYAHCLLALIQINAGHVVEAKKALEPILKNPMNRYPGQEGITQKLKEIPETFQKALSNSKPANRLEDATRVLYDLVWLLSLGKIQAEGFTAFDVKMADLMWTQSLSQLKAQLEK